MANENEKKTDAAADAAKAEKAAKAAKNKAAGEAKKKAKGESAQGVRIAAAGETKVSGEKAPRLETIYKKEIVPSLMKQLNEKNPMAIPRLSKVVLNCAIKDAVANPKVLDSAMDEILAITGQKAVLTRSRKAIASFKVREGNAVGVMVTLRRARMYEFLDRLMNVALPRVRDFKGVSAKSFDGRGNYSLGLREQIIFPEINYDKVDKIRGMTITIATTAKNNEQARALLAELGMPFRK
ncbi:MAG: 50S ribosomal protein L5 [Bdellovibrionales bacterium]|nr:50S ribosomal protein L5 [Bdellovibrionales bacterium]